MASDLCDTIEEKLLIGDRPKIIETPENKLPLRERLCTRKEDELKEVALLYPLSFKCGDVLEHMIAFCSKS